MNNIKILDCTLRDGGYYTNWDFNEGLVEEYAISMNNLPIDYIEVGYRSIPLDGYLGEYFYCPIFTLQKLKKLMPLKELAIILNEKDVVVDDLFDLLTPIRSYVSLIRVAVDPQNLKRALLLAKAIKELGFMVAFNVMYMSKWKSDSSFLDLLEGQEAHIDYFYMVDSYGGILPHEVIEIVRLVKSKTNIPLGFHGHNNIEMALVNSITALDEGCGIVDATITGMGRGAGNLKMELLLTYLDSKYSLKLDFNELSKIVFEFEILKEKYKWGTSLPYMFSGSHSLPQKQVMEWVGLNRYSLSSILNALNNKKMLIEDNAHFPILEKEDRYKKAVIIGGGQSSRLHSSALMKYMENNSDTCLIHAGAKNIHHYYNIICNQFYALVGVELDEFSKQKYKDLIISDKCVFPPYPRKMGISLPSSIKENSRELSEIDFISFSHDSPFTVAVQTALDLGVEQISLFGFDGYDVNINQNQFLLAQENQKIIDYILNDKRIDLISLTPTKYNNIELKSIYGLI